jgi:L-fucose isomerase-like protein
MLNDERPHVVAVNAADYLAEDAIRTALNGTDGSGPELVMSAETVKNVGTAQAVGEQLHRAGCRSVVMVYRAWNWSERLADERRPPPAASA